MSKDIKDRSYIESVDETYMDNIYRSECAVDCLESLSDVSTEIIRRSIENLEIKDMCMKLSFRVYRLIMFLAGNNKMSVVEKMLINREIILCQKALDRLTVVIGSD